MTDPIKPPAPLSAPDLGGILGKPADTPVTHRRFDDTDAARQAIFDHVHQSVLSRYPMENTRYSLHIENPSFKGNKPFSIADQKAAIMGGDSLEHKLTGEWVLRDKTNGLEVDRKKGVIAHVPYLTHRGTFIYKGSEYTVANQMRLKPGVFTRVKDNGQIEAHVNVKPGTGQSFRVHMEPETGIFRLNVGQSNLKLYPILRAMGASDKDIEKHWGRELLQKNVEAEDPRAVSRAFAKLVSTRADQAVGGVDAEAVEKIAGVADDAMHFLSIDGEHKQEPDARPAQTPDALYDRAMSRPGPAAPPSEPSAPQEPAALTKKSDEDIPALLTPARATSTLIRRLYSLMTKKEKKPNLSVPPTVIEELQKESSQESVRLIGTVGEDLATYMSRYIKLGDKPKPKLVPVTSKDKVDAANLPERLSKIAAPLSPAPKTPDMLRQIRDLMVDRNTEDKVREETRPGFVNTAANLGIGAGALGLGAAGIGHIALNEGLDKAQRRLNKYKFHNVSKAAPDFQRVTDTRTPQDFVHQYTTSGSRLMNEAKLQMPNGQMLSGPEVMEKMYKMPGFDRVARMAGGQDTKTTWTPGKAQHYAAFKEGPLSGYQQMMHEVLEEPFAKGFGPAQHPLQQLVGATPGQGYAGIRAEGLRRANQEGVWQAAHGRATKVLSAHVSTPEAMARYGLTTPEQAKAWVDTKAQTHAFAARQNAANRHAVHYMYENPNGVIDHIKDFLPAAHTPNEHIGNLQRFVGGMEDKLRTGLGTQGYQDLSHTMSADPVAAHTAYAQAMGGVPSTARELAHTQAAHAAQTLLPNVIDPTHKALLEQAIKTQNYAALPHELQGALMKQITSSKDPVHRAMLQRLDNGWRNRIGGYKSMTDVVSKMEQAQQHLNTNTIPWLRRTPGRVAMGTAGGILGVAGIAKLVDHIRRGRKENNIRQQAEQVKAPV